MRIKVGVIFGGKTVEHEVSIITAIQAMNSIDSKKVINQVRLKREDISWMAIDMKGTNIIVNIVEAEKKPTIIDKNTFCNIVASKEGMITKITADMGTATVKKAANAFIDTNLKVNGVASGKVSYTEVVGLIMDYYYNDNPSYLQVSR